MQVFEGAGGTQAVNLLVADSASENRIGFSNFFLKAKCTPVHLQFR